MDLKFSDLMVKERLVLKAGELKAQRGFITVVSGESGSGKTTLFKALKKDEYACSGQFPLFLERFTLGEHFDLMGIKPLASECVALGCDALMEKKPQMLSGGEKKRASFLFSASREAVMYMFDEPTASQNEEYVGAFIDVLLRLKREDKAVIVFTHDKRLMEIGDIRHEIMNRALVRLDDKETADRLFDIESVAFNPNLSHFVSVAVKRQGKGARNGAMIALAILVSLCFSYGRILNASQQGILRQMQSNELLAFKGVASLSQYNGQVYYSPNFEFPLGEEEMKLLSSIESVTDVEWRYDVLEDGTMVYDDITSESFDLIKDSDEKTIHFYHIELLENGASLGVVDARPCQISTYMKEHKLLKDIEIDFGCEGIYVSKCLANTIMKSTGLDEEELNGKTLRFSVSLPMYNTFGRVKSAMNNDDYTYIWNTTVEHEMMEVPVAGILEWSSFGIPNSHEYAMYVERSLLEPLIEKHRAKEDRVLYVESSDYDVWYLNELPEDKKDAPMNRVFEDYAWQPTAVSLWTNTVESISSVVEQLDEAGFFVIGEFTELGGVWNGVGTAKRTVRNVSFLLAGVYLLACIGIKAIGRKKEQDMRAFFRSCGMGKHDLHNALSKAWLQDTLGQLKTALITFIVIFAVLSLLFRYVLIPAAIGLVSLIVLICYWGYGLNVLMDKVFSKETA